ncbi:MAG: helix-turn-helix transcriptional regulator [Rhodothermales bacterium]|nr:helix-turn-helix transcriptional regulator [Rhodothermales bacterium]MBO6780239.1 helix-turn-helix transcriptional regulator [Rhodothermales bacterium]
MSLLSRTEELLLLSVWHLQEDAYGLAVRDRMRQLLDRKLSVGAVYVPLERLARKGFLASREADPTPERGGRRTRYYRLTEKGVAALAHVRSVTEEAWAGVPSPLSPSVR